MGTGGSDRLTGEELVREGCKSLPYKKNKTELEQERETVGLSPTDGSEGGTDFRRHTSREERRWEGCERVKVTGTRNPI